ncbi:terpene synthase family protein [Embleya sp. AB8]|uniref:terpene synthase family protein n=1 Tax=Embleya sp. AB8 TaxID=3156304 RepID=UPI003C76177C
MVEAHPTRIPLPFALDRNPHAPDAECRLLDWARRHELLDHPAAETRLIGARLADLAAYTHPDAEPDRLCRYAQFLGWQFLTHDRCAQPRERAAPTWEHVIGQVEPIFRTGRAESAAGPMGRALADLLGRVYPAMGAEWRERFAAECVETMRHAVPRTAGDSPAATREYASGVQAYIRHRRLAGGQFPCLLLDEYMADGELPVAIRDGAAYDDIRNAEADVVSWTCDYYSSRSNTETDAPADLVGVLAYTEHLGREHAEAAVAARIQDRVADFLTARRTLQGGGSDVAWADPEADLILRRCVSAMHNRMAGTEAWAWENVRSLDHHRPADGRRTGEGGGLRVPQYVEDLLDVRGRPRGWDGGAAGHRWP